MAKKLKTRNIAFCGHGSSGKTTLTDKLLVKTGAVNANPSVDDGTSICDFDPEEKSHQYTVEASVTHLENAGTRFNVIDTPGYPDFIGQTIGALRGVDVAGIVIGAQAGIEVNTRRVYAEAEKAGLGSGEWLRVSTSFDVKLSDFGIAIPGMAAAKVNDTWKVTVQAFTGTEK